MFYGPFPMIASTRSTFVVFPAMLSLSPRFFLQAVMIAPGLHGLKLWGEVIGLAIGQLSTSYTP
jgi:hypothetical protein